MSSPRARYNFWMTPAGTLCIEDLYDPLAPSKTVTNDLERVLSEILPTLDASGQLEELERIIYRDSEKNWAAVTVLEHRCLVIEQVEVTPLARKNELLAERDALIYGAGAFKCAVK